MSHVEIISRRMVLPEPASSLRPEPETTIDLSPWDLRMITLEYIQTGILVPKPPTTGGRGHQFIIEHLASSFARGLFHFYPYVGRLAVTPCEEGRSIAISLRCSMEGAEFIHAVAPGVTIADVIKPLYTPRVVRSFFPLNGLRCIDATAGSHPLLAVQVTELDDGLFMAMSLNHVVGDGTAFSHLINTLCEIIFHGDGATSSPLPVHRRWFLDGCPVPVPLPFGKLEDIASRHMDEHPLPLVEEECFLHFSSETIRKLKAKAKAEIADTGINISSLQALLVHLWIAVCRARMLAPDHMTTYALLVGYRGRLDGIQAAYAGNAVGRANAVSTAGEILQKGLGWAALLLNRAVASFDAASERDRLASWPQNPSFASVKACPVLLMTGSSPRFDVYGNDFGWGRPVGVRSGPANKMDGMATVYQGRDGGGSLALEVCLAPEVLARLVSDEEFMGAVSAATA